MFHQLNGRQSASQKSVLTTNGFLMKTSGDREERENDKKENENESQESKLVSVRKHHEVVRRCATGGCATHLASFFCISNRKKKKKFSRKISFRSVDEFFLVYDFNRSEKQNEEHIENWHSHPTRIASHFRILNRLLLSCLLSLIFSPEHC